ASALGGEARRRGVQVLPVDINASGDKCVAVGDGVEVWKSESLEAPSCSGKAAAGTGSQLNPTSQPPQLSPSARESCGASDHVQPEGFVAPLLSHYNTDAPDPRRSASTPPIARCGT